mgnify:CR=1 FL=1
MERPTTKVNYTKEELREYALSRKKQEMTDINKINSETGGDWEEIEKHPDYKMPLSYDESKEIKILLSWGGGEDGFKLNFDKENELTGGKYYWADWGVYEEVELSFEEAEKVAEFYQVEGMMNL